jgi:acetophenone carboxylase
MSGRRRITEYLDIDLERESWVCHRCDRSLISARENYKRGCLVYERDPRTLYPPTPAAQATLAPDPEWCRLLEFYCPGCGTMVEVELLPPGHPITWDIQVDVDALKTAVESKE